MSNPLDRFILVRKGEAKIIRKEIDKSFVPHIKEVMNRKINPHTIRGFLNNSYHRVPPNIFFKYIFEPPTKHKFNMVSFPKVNRRFT